MAVGAAAGAASRCGTMAVGAAGAAMCGQQVWHHGINQVVELHRDHRGRLLDHGHHLQGGFRSVGINVSSGVGMSECSGTKFTCFTIAGC